MKRLFYVFLLLILSCNTEPLNETDLLKSQSSTEARQTDPAEKNRKKVMFYPTVEGTFEERLASLQIAWAHAKPVSFNWDFTNGADIKDPQNLEVLRVVIYEKDNPTQWISQTSTSGWRGFWVADYDRIEKGKTYILDFQTYGIKVEFIMPEGKI